jgi:hypothetical protein
MFDWRILSAAFVAFLFVSGVFVSNIGLRDFLNSIIQRVSEWMKTSPFGGFFTSPTKKPKEVEFSIHTKELTLKPDAKVSLISDKFALSGFRGKIMIDLENQKIKLTDSTSSLQINLSIDGEATIENLKLSTFSLENVKFEVSPMIKTNNGSIFLNDFSGNVSIKSDGVHFYGEVTSFKTKIEDNTWELA